MIFYAVTSGKMQYSRLYNIEIACYSKAIMFQ